MAGWLRGWVRILPPQTHSKAAGGALWGGKGEVATEGTGAGCLCEGRYTRACVRGARTEGTS